ncbi:MAG: hypothetical protein JSV63_02075 [Candidatus Aenigmatarchaeota archaeon]|nr:MAG: hypothetical protein JSV63_02075 [Candidatus Aenigmarchaeota archaeon]
MVMFLLIVIALISGITLGSLFTPRTSIVYNTTISEGYEDFAYTTQLFCEGIPDPRHSTFSSVVIPAVDTEGNGITTRMFVQTFPGSGRVLTNIDRLLFWVDTQNSIRRATQIAENLTGMNLGGYDIVYTIQANASVIGGPSAGAAIAIVTIAALQNKTINDSVIITGSVNHDGTIGPVGNIVEKAIASKEAGAELFLVPLAQSTEVTYRTREYCEKIGWVDWCSTETYPVKLDIEEEAGLSVKEVMDIGEAAEYMLI